VLPDVACRVRSSLARAARRGAAANSSASAVGAAKTGHFKEALKLALVVSDGETPIASQRRQHSLWRCIVTCALVQSDCRTYAVVIAKWGIMNHGEIDRDNSVRSHVEIITTSSRASRICFSPRLVEAPHRV